MLRSSLWVFLGVLAIASNSYAGLLVSDGFNYNSSADLISSTAGGAGFAAGSAWTFSNPGGTSGAASVVPGLTFSDLPVSGNAVVVDSGNGWSGELSRPSGVAAADTDTLWVSFLFQRQGTSHYISSTTYGVVASHDNGYYPNMNTWAKIDTYAMPNEGPGVRRGASPATASGETALGQTYLVISRFAQVGINGGAPGADGKMWMLTTADYDAIKAGGITEAELDAQVPAAFQALTAVSWTTTQGFPVGETITLGGSYTNNSGQVYGTLDELRIGVGADPQSAGVLVPEPASLTLMLVGGLAFLRRR